MDTPRRHARVTAPGGAVRHVAVGSGGARCCAPQRSLFGWRHAHAPSRGTSCVLQRPRCCQDVGCHKRVKTPCRTLSLSLSLRTPHPWACRPPLHDDAPCTECRRGPNSPPGAGCWLELTAWTTTAVDGCLAVSGASRRRQGAAHQSKVRDASEPKTESKPSKEVGGGPAGVSCVCVCVCAVCARVWCTCAANMAGVRQVRQVVCAEANAAARSLAIDEGGEPRQ